MDPGLAVLHLLHPTDFLCFCSSPIFPLISLFASPLHIFALPFDVNMAVPLAFPLLFFFLYYRQSYTFFSLSRDKCPVLTVEMCQCSLLSTCHQLFFAFIYLSCFPLNNTFCLTSLCPSSMVVFLSFPLLSSFPFHGQSLFLLTCLLALPDEATTVLILALIFYSQPTMFFSCLLSWRLVSALYFFLFFVWINYF